VARTFDAEIIQRMGEANIALTYSARNYVVEARLRYLYEAYREGLYKTRPAPPKTIETVCGVVLLDGEPLPEDWRGAEYTYAPINLHCGYWRIQFGSKWSDKVLEVFLNRDTHGAADAKALAAVFLETINQRRLG
jgi:hypothetical protein